MLESLLRFYSGDIDSLLNCKDASSLKSTDEAIISLGSIFKQYSSVFIASIVVYVFGLPITCLHNASNSVGGVSIIKMGRSFTQLIYCLPTSMTKTAFSTNTS